MGHPRTARAKIDCHLNHVDALGIDADDRISLDMGNRIMDFEHLSNNRSIGLLFVSRVHDLGIW